MSDHPLPEEPSSGLGVVVAWIMIGGACVMVGGSIRLGRPMATGGPTGHEYIGPELGRHMLVAAAGQVAVWVAAMLWQLRQEDALLPACATGALAGALAPPVGLFCLNAGWTGALLGVIVSTAIVLMLRTVVRANGDAP